MKFPLKTLVCALSCGVLLSIEPAPAMANPTAGAMSHVAANSVAISEVQLAQFRRGSPYRGGYRDGYRSRRDGTGIALGIGAALIGGILLSESGRAEHRSSNGDQWDRCAETYRSFEPSTGLYTGYDGVRRTCPYLR